MAEVHGNGRGLQRRDPPPKAKRNIRAHQPRIHVADGPSKDRLEKRENGPENSQSAEVEKPLAAATAPTPAWGRDHRQARRQCEKEERQRQMRGRDRIWKPHQYGESAEETLHQQQSDSGQRPPTNRWAPGFGSPGHVGCRHEDQNEAPGDESVQVLPENAARHIG